MRSSLPTKEVATAKPCFACPGYPTITGGFMALKLTKKKQAALAKTARHLRKLLELKEGREKEKETSASEDGIWVKIREILEIPPPEVEPTTTPKDVGSKKTYVPIFKKKNGGVMEKPRKINPPIDSSPKWKQVGMNPQGIIDGVVTCTDVYKFTGCDCPPIEVPMDTLPAKPCSCMSQKAA